MRALTFAGFLTKYVRELSYCESNSLYKLAAEAGESNARLREPLFLYAVFTDRAETLRKAVRGTGLSIVYGDLFDKSKSELAEALQSDALPPEYRKVWRSYLVKKNRHQTENETKELMRQRILRLQRERSLSNYRLYTALGLNPGNLNAWLKHGQSDKVSLETARAVLQYLR